MSTAECLAPAAAGSVASAGGRGRVQSEDTGQRQQADWNSGSETGPGSVSLSDFSDFCNWVFPVSFSSMSASLKLLLQIVTDH